MYRYLIFGLLLISFGAHAADGESTEYFGALWDFIDWIYDAFDNLGQTILDFLVEASKAIFLFWLNLKWEVLKFVWTIVEPLVDSLNLTDIISTLFSGISPDAQMFITELRLGEGLNLLLSAHITRAVLRAMGW